MSTRLLLSLVLVGALGALAFASTRSTDVQATTVGFADVVRHHARGGITDIVTDSGAVIVHLDASWNADSGEGHDAQRHWSVAEVGDGWVRFRGARGSEIFAPLERIVVRR
jgi:hypothetical protein